MYYRLVSSQILHLKCFLMKKNPTGKQHQRKPEPELKWQTGAYDRHAEVKFVLPYQFLLLCRLVDKSPEEIIRDFTDNLSCGSWKREGRDEAKEHLISYFVASIITVRKIYVKCLRKWMH